MSLLRHITNLKTAAFTAGVLLVSGVPLLAHGQSQAAAGARLFGWIGDAAAGAVDYAVVKPIVMFILTFSGWILGLAGVFFNWVVIKTVFQFGKYFGTSEGMLIAWGVLRDISNIGLLFGFIFMGVLLILNVDGGGHGHGGGMSAKKAIPRLIIFAVLLNFSLFASQAIIDVANAFGSQFATLAGTSCDAIEDSGDCANVGISGQVLQMAGIGSIWSDALLAGKSTDSVVLLGLSLFVIITALVLIAAGIMLVIRVVILSLLMVTSPIGFAGMVIPGLQGVASKWWHMLISQSFFAPVMLLLMFISLKLAESLNPNGDPLVKAFSGESTGVAENMQVVVVFAIVIGFMIASLAAAARMGAMGATFATNTASAVTFGALTRGTNFAVGGTARLARFGVQNSRLKNSGAAQVLVNRGLRPLEKANLDMRRAPGMGGVLGAAGISAGAKPAEHATYGDIAHTVDDMRQGAGGKKLQRQYMGEIADQKLEKNAHDEKMDEADVKHLASMNTKELEALHGIQEGVKQMAQNLTPEQFENLMKSDKLDDAQKGKLRDGRLSALVGATDDATKKWTTKDLEQLASSSEYVKLLSDKDFVKKLSDDQAEALGKSSKLTTAQKEAFDKARDARFEPDVVVVTMGKMSAEKVGKLHPSTFEKPHVRAAMSGRQLAAIDPEKLSPTQLEAVRTHIKAQIGDKTAAGREFSTLMAGNPKTKERWGGVL